MRWRGITMSAQSVSWIQDDRKVETRRVASNLYVPEEGGRLVVRTGSKSTTSFPGDPSSAEVRSCVLPWCHYGGPGDGLYVRERWRLQYDEVADLHYVRYGDSPILVLTDDGGSGDALRAIERDEWRRATKMPGWWLGRWRPAHLMPRWASRLQLVLEGVRVETAMEITAEGCIAEGFRTTARGHDARVGLRQQFAAEWFRLNSHARPRRRGGEIAFYESYPWGGTACETTYRGKPHFVRANPWVWVLRFRKATAAEVAA